MRQQKQWTIYHQYEWAYKKHYLRRLSLEDSVKIFKDLERLGKKIRGNGEVPGLNKEKIKALAYVHALFGKVK